MGRLPRRGHILAHRSSAAWTCCVGVGAQALPIWLASPPEATCTTRPTTTPPLRWRHEVRAAGRVGVLSRAPSSTRPARARGGCTGSLSSASADDADDPWRRCAQGARIMRAIQRLAGSKLEHDALAGASAMPESAPPWAALWNFATTSCSSLVPTTPKSAKGSCCSLNSAGKRSIMSPP